VNDRLTAPAGIVPIRTQNNTPEIAAAGQGLPPETLARQN
jgi:hypothetical protein